MWMKGISHMRQNVPSLCWDPLNGLRPVLASGQFKSSCQKALKPAEKISLKMVEHRLMSEIMKPMGDIRREAAGF